MTEHSETDVPITITLPFRTWNKVFELLARNPYFEVIPIMGVIGPQVAAQIAQELNDDRVAAGSSTADDPHPPAVN